MDGDRAGGPAPALSPRVAGLRLAAVAATLAGAFAAFWIFDLLDTDDVRGLVEPFGAFAPVAYVVVSGLLGAALVPGPVLAATSGVLFGAAVGTIVTIASSVLTAVLALLAARRTASDAVETLSGPRLEALSSLARDHGTVAVIVQRLIPGVPDAPASYVFGALGLRVWQIALGTAVGAAPRAFSYTSIGASIDDPDSPLAFAGVAVLVLTAVVGAELARRVVTRSRRARPARPPLPRSGEAHGRRPPSAG